MLFFTEYSRHTPCCHYVTLNKIEDYNIKIHCNNYTILSFNTVAMQIIAGVLHMNNLYL